MNHLAIGLFKEDGNKIKHFDDDKGKWKANRTL